MRTFAYEKKCNFKWKSVQMWHIYKYFRQQLIQFSSEPGSRYHGHGYLNLISPNQWAVTINQIWFQACQSSCTKDLSSQWKASRTQRNCEMMKYNLGQQYNIYPWSSASLLVVMVHILIHKYKWAEREMAETTDVNYCFWSYIFQFRIITTRFIFLCFLWMWWSR